MNKMVGWKNKRYRISALLVVLLLASVLSACTKNQDDVDFPVFDAIGGEFTMPASVGRDVSLSDYQGKVVLINFGFTHCPDVCPMVLTRLAKLTKALQEQHGIGADRVQTLFISVDPERDNTQHLKEFLAFFNADFIGLSGTIEQTGKITKQYGAFYEKQAPESDGSYRVIHNDRIFMIDKRGRLRALYAQSDLDEKILSGIVSLSEADI